MSFLGFNDLFFDLIVPNVFYDEKFNLEVQKSLLDQVSLSRGVIRKGELIIAQGDLEIGIFHVQGEFFAYENNCVHQGGPACQGKIINKVEEVIHEKEKTAHGLKFSETDIHIVCPWHGYEYNVRDGRHPGSKNIRLKPFKVKIKDEEVYVVV